MTPEAIAGLVLSILGTLAIIITGIRWFVTTVVHSTFQDVSTTILMELKTNGGSSIKDEVRSIKCDQELNQHANSAIHKALAEKIDSLTKLFVEYVARH